MNNQTPREGWKRRSDPAAGELTAAREPHFSHARGRERERVTLPYGSHSSLHSFINTGTTSRRRGFGDTLTRSGKLD